MATACDGAVPVYSTRTSEPRGELPGRFLAVVPDNFALTSDVDERVLLVELGSGRIR